MTAAIVVTGGSQGIGAATVRTATARGMNVVVLSRHAASISHNGADVVGIDTDVADEQEVERAFAALDAQSVRVAGLVNCAGVMGQGTRIDSCSVAMFQHIFSVNVLGTFLACRAAIRRMSTRQGGLGGAIVNLSSMAAILGGAGEYAHYAAAKGAIESLTIGLSRELAAEGIRVNAVRPGLIDTTLHHQGGDLGRLARLAPTVPIGRAGRDDEVAQAILWLLSDEASYVTGAIMPVAGGR